MAPDTHPGKARGQRLSGPTLCPNVGGMFVSHQHLLKTLGTALSSEQSKHGTHALSERPSASSG